MTAGLPVREEIGVDCCHANQDKFWVVPVAKGLAVLKIGGGCCSSS